ncbi:release factor glutamine methyltransferase [Virgibacillus natechei]|uniref:Release factor glutamine methyltransferase n=1 Tax=Virgibacillus natechei TaxID=1216297 RepID=A0ABS4IFY7_9BACI|nr:peptide chain release factor N(5)-glutamine methyltransferase [Virgibacillus natechei]MBP1969859.1 release factor glutamine methyltransferase [Virgibacillus natechei]UZD12610.1 peptide chain release factor N(5)-glutamine methyltransferase [Virgibacillus natechei]
MSIKQYEVLKRASLFLENHNREAKVAEILLQHHLQVSRSKFHMLMQDPVPELVLEPFNAAIEKHAETGVPVQHLTGVESFYGREFQVNEQVLIPRPETEELVQHVINVTKQNKETHPTIVDIGTGSGIIAITLALELPNANVYATDISEEALKIASENAAHLDASVTFLQGDFLQPLINHAIRPDLIVSNPPYIAKSDEVHLSDTVKTFDPKLALFAEENGLAAYRKIIEQLPEVLNEEGFIAFEIGYQQRDTVNELMKHVFPKSQVETLKDINKKDRILTAKINY